MGERVKTLILGAGPTGLGAGYRLNELGERDFLLLEQADRPGGLATSFVDAEGFTWDIGGHVQFSHYSYFDELMQRALGADGWLTHQREAWAWMRGRFVPYPVQNNLRSLPKEELWHCVEGMIEATAAASRGGPPPRDFREWITATFGAGLAKAFMLPYNYKVWAYPPEDLAYQWIGERVSVPDLKRVLKGVVLELDDIGWGPNETFRFPKHGGTGAVWRAVAELLGAERLNLHERVVEIRSHEKRVMTASGREVAYEKLLSTLPLDVLCRLVSPKLPDEVLAASSKLTHSTSNIVGIGLRGKVPAALRTKCWIYFPEDVTPFYRATVFSNYSPHNVPERGEHWSLMTETSESPKKTVDRSELVERTVAGCLATGLISRREDVVSTWLYSAEHGYPTPTLARDRALDQIHPSLEALCIHSRGRFGAWKYEVSNQDHSLMQGVEWVNNELLGQVERTLGRT